MIDLSRSQSIFSQRNVYLKRTSIHIHLRIFPLLSIRLIIKVKVKNSPKACQIETENLLYSTEQNLYVGLGFFFL